MKNNIQKYISELIYIYDCVIVPGFGSFITNYRPSQIDYSKSFIHPPTKEILFNHTLKHNDGLLVNHISGRTKKTLHEVTEEIELFVKDLYFELNQGRKVEFENIGFFYFDRRLNLIFEPSYVTNYLSETYGLATLDLPERMRQSAENTQTIYMDTSNRRKRIIVAAAISIPIILALSILPFKSKIFDNRNFSFSGLNPVNKTVISESPSSEQEPKDTMVMNDAIQDMTKAENALFYEEKKEIQKEILKPAMGTYFLIAGSFKDTQNAGILRNQLISEGYTNSEILESENGWYRVTFNVYEDKFLALQELTRIRKEKNDQSVWLFTKKRD